jgi:hypothetical protein
LSGDYSRIVFSGVLDVGALVWFQVCYQEADERVFVQDFEWNRAVDVACERD